MSEMIGSSQISVGKTLLLTFQKALEHRIV